jgi:hypothetical protein
MAVSVTQPPPYGGVPDKPPARSGFEAALEAELAPRIIGQKLEPIPPDFDPLDPVLEVGDFVRLGLPPRPADPAAVPLWLELIPPGLEIVAPYRDGGSAGLRFRTDMMVGAARMAEGERGDDPGNARVGLPSRGRFGSSRNWSGAAIFANRGNRFIQVIGSWTVPEVGPGNGEGPWVCSTWIGIDGLRRWMKSMPQMGTTQVVGETGEDDNGAPLPQYFAWWQWWLLGRSIQVPVVFPGVTIAPGKKIFCCVTLLPPDQPNPGDRHNVQFFLRVDGVGIPLAVSPPPSNDPMGKPDDPNGVPAHGASAEWILERPTALHDSPNGNVKEGELFPLPDFGSAGAEGFAASLAPDPDPTVLATVQAAPIGPAVNFRTPLQLRMMEHRRAPSRMAVIARPVEARDGKVTVVYQE